MTAVFVTYDFQVIQQSLGQQVSQPVAQIVAGFSKVFVGEIVEKGAPNQTLESKVVLCSHLGQLAQCKNGGENRDLCHQTIFAKRTAFINKRPGESVLPVL